MTYGSAYSKKETHEKHLINPFLRNFGDSRIIFFPQECHVCQRYEYKKQFYTKKDFVGIINLLIVWRGKVVTSRCHGSEPWSCRYSRKKKNEKIDMYDFPVLYGIKKQNGNANGRLCKERLFRSTIFAVISPALISFSGAPNGLNALPEVRFEFFFN